MKQTDSATKKENEIFWERERNANFARSRDISTLPYLTVPESALPFFDAGEDEREADLQKEVQKYRAKKMINLSGYSNTDLKEQYGAANLEELSGFDQNFMLFTRSLSNWGRYRYEQNDFARAKQVMEYALSIGSDISSVYTTLGHIYASEGNLSKIDGLIAEVDASDNSLKNSIIRQLQICKLE